MTTRPLLHAMSAVGDRPRLTISDANGATIKLADGREILDGGSISAALLGHRHPALVEALRSTADVPVISDGWGYGPREQAAGDLLDTMFAGEDWAAVVRFCCSASEANDLALTLAQSLTGRTPLVARDLGYHGSVGASREVSIGPLWTGTLAANGDGEWSAPPTTMDVRRLSASPSPSPGSDDDSELLERGLDEAPEKLEGAAALITDWGSNSLVFHSAAYQDRLAQIARDAGALWVADEAVTGLGRLGRPFAFQRGASRPDIVVLGKGLSGGAAASAAIVLSQRVVELLDGRRWLTYGTFRGHPGACAATSAVCRTIDQLGLMRRAATAGERFGDELRTIAARHPSVAATRGEGLLWSFELAGPARHDVGEWHGDGSALPVSEVASAAALEAGVLIPAYSGNVIWTVPPLTIEDQQLSGLLEGIDSALSAADAYLETLSPGI